MRDMTAEAAGDDLWLSARRACDDAGPSKAEDVAAAMAAEMTVAVGREEPSQILLGAADHVFDGSASAAALLKAFCWNFFPAALSCVGDAEGAAFLRNLSFRYLRELSAVASAREMNLMALSHLHAYDDPRAFAAIFEVVGLSLVRLPAPKRRVFLASSLSALWPRLQRFSSVTSDADAGDEECDGASGSDSDAELSPIATNAAGKSAAAAAARMPAVAAAAAALARPFLDLPPSSNNAASAAVLQPYVSLTAGAAATMETAAVTTPEIVAPLSGFLLNVLELVLGASDVDDGSGGGGGAEPPAKEKGARQQNVIRTAAGAVLDLLFSMPGVDLEFLLEHYSRQRYEQWRRRRQRLAQGGTPQTGGGDGGSSGDVGNDSDDALESLPAGCLPSTLGALTMLPPASWREEAVAAAAYVAVCDPDASRRWLPKVWSPVRLWDLCWPHAEVLLGNKTISSASRGIDLLAAAALPLSSSSLACAATAAPAAAAAPAIFPVRTRRTRQKRKPATAASAVAAAGGKRDGDSAADDDGGSGGNDGDDNDDPFDPRICDAGRLLRSLIDAVVACPEAALRSHGHAALEAVLAGIEPEMCFVLLESLVTECPFPNASGLLLDCFRKHVCAAMAAVCAGGTGIARAAAAMVGPAQQQLPPVAAPAAAEGNNCCGCGGSGTAAAMAPANPFASPRVAGFVMVQLEAMARCPSQELLNYMDVHLALIGLHRFCLLVDENSYGSGDSSGGGLLGVHVPEAVMEGAALLERFAERVRRKLEAYERQSQQLAAAAQAATPAALDAFAIGGNGAADLEALSAAVAASGGPVPRAAVSMDLTRAAKLRRRVPPDFFRLAMAVEAADASLLLMK
ncbi:unnamed protein product [Phaeothamnion confervicola]